MSLAQVDIYNMALAAVGAPGRVQLPTEVSPEAEVCQLWYESVRDLILRSAPWDCAKAHVRMAQQAVRELTDDETEGDVWVAADPAPGWQYAFFLPANLLAPRYLSTYARFELGMSADDKRVLYCNDPAPVLIYTKRQTRVDLWEVDLQHAIAFGLAAHIAEPLTGSANKVRLVTAQAIDKIMNARQASANMPNAGMADPLPEWLAARGYGGAMPSTQFIYPWANFQVMGTAVGVN